MYSKQFEVRWSDLDANRHLANSAYMNFMSHTRMGFFNGKWLRSKRTGRLQSRAGSLLRKYLLFQGDLRGGSRLR